jgi:hypothetical protein
MDAVAVKKSWTKPEITVYEVKVSRSDFTSDDKWPRYAELANRFYFACQKGLITKKDVQVLGPNVGLVWVYPSGHNRAIVKPPYIPNIPPENLLYYILMNGLDSDRPRFGMSWRESLIQDYLDKRIRCTGLATKFHSTLVSKCAEAEERARVAEVKLDHQSELIRAVKEKLGIRSKWDITRYVSQDVQQLVDEMGGMANVEYFMRRLRELARIMVARKEGGSDAKS